MGRYGWSRWRTLVSRGAGTVNATKTKKKKVVILGTLDLYTCVLPVFMSLFPLVCFFFPASFSPALPCLPCSACIDKNCKKEDNCATAIFLKYASPQFPFSLSLSD